LYFFVLVQEELKKSKAAYLWISARRQVLNETLHSTIAFTEALINLVNKQHVLIAMFIGKCETSCLKQSISSMFMP